jgi:hypothetical protein
LSIARFDVPAFREAVMPGTVVVQSFDQLLPT